MQNWAFFDGNGNEINRGWQGWESDAHKQAQLYANARGVSVELVEEPAKYDYENDMPAKGETFEPETNS